MSNRSKKINPLISINCGPWQFAPNIKLSIITLILIIILAYLGVWQLGRASYKENIFMRLQEKIKKGPTDLQSITHPSLEKDRFTNVSLDGAYLNKYTFLLDNQMLDHKVGFRVLTVVQSPRLDKWVLIDRGWVPLDKDRQNLPKIDPIYGVKQVTGIINTIGSGMVLKKDVPNFNAEWPIVIQELNYEFMTQQLHHPVYEFVVQLHPPSPSPYPYPPIDYGLSSDKHHGYALEWFAIASLVFIYFIIASSKRRS